jgi:hypothetical protein
MRFGRGRGPAFPGPPRLFILSVVWDFKLSSNQARPEALLVSLCCCPWLAGGSAQPAAAPPSLPHKHRCAPPPIPCWVVVLNNTGRFGYFDGVVV